MGAVQEHITLHMQFGKWGGDTYSDITCCGYEHSSLVIRYDP